MTVALIDDQLLGQVLRGATPRSLAAAELYTTGYWYVRLCQAALGADERVEELARMLGGVEITAAARRHAREMLEPRSPARSRRR